MIRAKSSLYHVIALLQRRRRLFFWQSVHQDCKRYTTWKVSFIRVLMGISLCSIIVLLNYCTFIVIFSRQSFSRSSLNSYDDQRRRSSSTTYTTYTENRYRQKKCFRYLWYKLNLILILYFNWCKFSSQVWRFLWHLRLKKCWDGLCV